MLDYCLAGLILLGLLLVVARLEGPMQPPSRGVAIVNDGDSITLSGQRVRLWGIDAPEYAQTCARDGKSYPCGRESRASLQQLIAGRAVICDSRGTDRYGRLLGDCRTGQVELNAAQVAAGWAVSYGGFEREEAQARRARVGLWTGEFDAPRDWRTRHGHAVEPRHEFLAMIGDKARAWLSWLLGRS